VKILILKPSSLGDVVQALPVLRLLKRHLPQSEIYWWVASSFAPLLEGDPDLAGVIRFERRRWAAPQHWPELWQSIRWMRRQGFDWVIDLQSLARSGAFAWLANGKLTIGLDEPREGARGFYDLIVRRPSFHTHAVDWYLGVLPLLGLPGAERRGPALGEGTDIAQSWSSTLRGEDFAWLPERPEIASSIRQKWPVETSRWIIVQPGARWHNKRWPAEHFADLVARLTAGQPDFRFAILGTEQDRPLAQLIQHGDAERCLDLTGRTSLPEMVEWIRISELMVTNDTGPMHVAAALNKPVVGLFGPTEPRRTGPYGQLEHVLQLDLPCVPCLSQRCTYSKPMECLRAISPEAVAEVVKRRLVLNSEAAQSPAPAMRASKNVVTGAT
jgi:heptosyltransferase I